MKDGYAIVDASHGRAAGHERSTPTTLRNNHHQGNNYLDDNNNQYLPKRYKCMSLKNKVSM